MAALLFFSCGGAEKQSVVVIQPGGSGSSSGEQTETGGGTGENGTGGSASSPFVLGSDVSWLSEMEQDGKTFKGTDGREEDLFTILKSLGQKAIRLRVWVDPEGGWSGKEDVTSLAKRASAAGMDIMIDFHYSDFFADPSRQTVPAAWEADIADIDAMCAHVEDHTREILTALKEAGVTPRWVQTGNETRNGMLWPLGQIWTDSGRTASGKANFIRLVNAGYGAAKSVFPDSEVLVHLDNAYEDNDWWFSEMSSSGAKFDAIGLSHYPQTNPSMTWEKMNSAAAARISALGKKYSCPVLISEVGTKSSDFTLAAKVMTGFLDAIRDIDSVEAVFYWEPEVYGWWKPSIYATLGWNAYDMGAFLEDGSPSGVMTAFH